MPNPTPPAAACFITGVLGRPLTAGWTYLVTAHTDPTDPHDPAGVRFSYVGLPPAAVADLPGYLRALAPAFARHHTMKATVVGYGIAWPSQTRVVMVDRHGQLARIRPVHTPPTHTRDEDTLAHALTTLMAAAPGLLEAPPVGRDTTARTGRRRVPPAHRRVGVAAVFAPAWAHAQDSRGRWYARFGYRGQPLDPGGDGSVFSCTPQVAERIVADYLRLREEYEQALRRTGHHGPLLDRAVDDTFVIVDLRTHWLLHAATTSGRDRHAVLRPTTDGTFLVGGPAWRCVDPDACEHLT